MFDNERLDLSMILQVTILSDVSILFDTILSLGTVRWGAIFPFVTVLRNDSAIGQGIMWCGIFRGIIRNDSAIGKDLMRYGIFHGIMWNDSTVLSFGFDVEWYGNEVCLTNLFDNKLDEEDLIVNSNDNRC